MDAAIWKLIRLCGGLTVRSRDSRAQRELEEFFRTVDIGWGQRGVQAFLDRYLDDLFTCGHALGEIVLDGTGREIAALLCAGLCFARYYWMSRNYFGGITGDLAGYFLQMCELWIAAGAVAMDVVLKVF